MGGELRPSRAVLPGSILREELEARGWTQKELARLMGRPATVINEIVRGRKQITPETALQLSAALGTSAEFWLNLETSYRLHQARQKQAETMRTPPLYGLTPVVDGAGPQ